jgi:tetratricopeptide (TPR) repeat protein
LVLERGSALGAEATRGDGADDLRIELGLTCFSLGDMVAALKAVEEVLRLREPLWVFANAEILLGRVLIERGNLERGRAHFTEALAIAQRIGAREVALTARVRLADATLAAGRPAEAAEQAREVATAADALNLRPLLYDAQAVLTAALVELGSSDEAAELARECVVRARSQRLRVHEAINRRALGLALVHLGDSSQGRKHLDTAAEVFERIGAQIELARTLRAIAQVEPAS